MLNISQQGNNLGINASKTGVYNEFVAPITDESQPKKDSIKFFLTMALLLTILLGIGAFVYAKILKNDVETKKQQLAMIDTDPNVSQFEASLPEMRALSQRLKLLNSIYDNKTYTAGMLFPILESVVESSRDSYVYFNKFSLKKESSNSLSSILLSGVALDYATLYRQLNNFRNSQYSGLFSNFKLSNLNVDENGNVLFDISFYIDISTPSFVKYVSGDTNFSSSTTPIVYTSGPLFRNATTSVLVATTTQTTTSSTTPQSLPTNNPSATTSQTVPQRGVQVPVNIISN